MREEGLEWRRKWSASGGSRVSAIHLIQGKNRTGLQATLS